ncbi:hypothetical protein FPSE_07760, partial [Fusarium pseudograminearum CS3096]
RAILRVYLYNISYKREIIS